MIVVNPAVTKNGYKIFDQTLMFTDTYSGKATKTVSIPGLSTWTLAHVFILTNVLDSGIWKAPGIDTVSFPLYFQAVSSDPVYLNLNISVTLQNDTLTFTINPFGGSSSKKISIQLCVVYKE